MKAQHSLQKQILARTRSLGLVGQLPAFQAAVPSELKYLLGDKNATDNMQGTAWLDSLDPLFMTIADKWMKTMINDFGTDHWYQLDGYFNGGTAPWYGNNAGSLRASEHELGAPPPPKPPGYWSKRGEKAWASLSNSDPDAIWSYQGWAILNANGSSDMMAGFVGAVPPGRISIVDMASDGSGEWRDWLKLNPSQGRSTSSNVGADAAQPASSSTAMAPFHGAHFIWTSLHTFGGMDSLRGNLSRANDIPFLAMDTVTPNGGVWGSGFTPEGIDQNPAFYEFLIEQNWRASPVPDIASHLVERAHRRYALPGGVVDPDVTTAWSLLAASAYTLDLWGMDSGGVTHLPGDNYNDWAWEPVGKPCTRQHCSADYTLPYQPTAIMCSVWTAWGAFLRAGPRMDASLEPWTYDLVNIGREVLAQIATPLSVQFNATLWNATAHQQPKLNAEVIKASAEAYVDVLHDLDELLNTDSAFQVGGWIEQARNLAAQQPGTDCHAKGFGADELDPKDCAHFYEWYVPPPPPSRNHL
jgi:alpha-N-acetylglucosaminidase